MAREGERNLKNKRTNTKEVERQTKIKCWERKGWGKARWFKYGQLEKEEKNIRTTYINMVPRYWN